MGEEDVEYGGERPTRWMGEINARPNGFDVTRGLLDARPKSHGTSMGLRWCDFTWFYIFISLICYCNLITEVVRWKEV